MTLAVLGRVASGFILATDRIQGPSEMHGPESSREPGLSGIFLSRDRPLGAVVWGAGGLGSHLFSEIASRVEDAEREGSSSIDQIARRLAQFLFHHGRQKFSSLLPYLRPRLGFFLAGFEAEGEMLARDRLWEMSEPFSPPRSVRSDRSDNPQYGFNWRGQELWMTRLILGYDPHLLDRLEAELAIPQDRLLPLFREVEMPISYSSMDLEQAMEMAAYLINTTLSLLHLRSYPRRWEWQIEMAIVTPEGARRVLPQEPQET